MHLFTPLGRAVGCAALGIFLATPLLSAQTPAPNPSSGSVPPLYEQVEVVATKVPERVEDVPAPVEVFSGEELRSRGVTDLRSALAFATGVDVAPGGDNGPAASVPEFMGLKEFDAFLLVVDGVPWGGAFNPSLGTLSLDDVERIEVLRGPAPVTYGATSFVGAIHVVHRRGSERGGSFTARGGSFGSGAASASLAVPLGAWTSRLSADFERRGFSDDRTSFRKGHFLWRADRALSNGRTWFAADTTWLDQDPASPHPRQGASLSAAVPLDANHNPSGAFLNETRAAFSGGYVRKTGLGEWTTTASVSHSGQDVFRGFLSELDEAPDNARGLREKIDVTDIYADSHLAWTPSKTVQLIAGGDYLHGNGDATGADFEYAAPLDGRTAAVVPEPTTLDRRVEDLRDFFGAYAMAEWRPHDRLRVDGGVRLNITREDRGGEEGAAVEAGEEEAAQTHVRPSASIGATWTAWQRGTDAVRLYANYRDTFKPAAFDFGLGEAEGGGEEGGLLEPETSRSVEGGVKTRWVGGRVGADVSVFTMRFENLVIAQAINGLPALANAGTERFKGVETAVSAVVVQDLVLRGNYSFHDATFLDYLTEFDGVPTQLSGKRLEMSPNHLAALGLVYAPARGPIGAFVWRYTGDRYLNKRNTALAEGFATLDASAGFRLALGEIRFDAVNLTDRRDPVAESELGDAQYYRMPARRVDVGYAVRF
jgi:outer membrane receptor protein involved in Fe transport